MTWAWRQPLTSTQRFVLLALADAADDNGACWPSVSTLADRCVMSTRTVQRALQDLIAANLIHSDPRQRGDGSTTSNRYVLHLGGGDTVTGAPVVDVTGGCHGCRGAPDTDVTPRTTNRTVIDPSPPLPRIAAPVVVTDGGETNVLIYPGGFSEKEKGEAKRRLHRIPAKLAQQLLDELSDRMWRGDVKTTPLAYLTGLTRRAEAGTFVPCRPLAHRTTRVPRIRAETAPLAAEIPRALNPVYPDVRSNPLCQRVAEIQNKAAQRRATKSSPAQPSELPTTPAPSEQPVTTDSAVEIPPMPLEPPARTRVVGG